VPSRSPRPSTTAHARKTSALREDLRRWIAPEHPLRLSLAAKKLVAFPGVQAAVLFRLQSALQERHRTNLARVVSAVNLRLTGAYFGVGCRVGGGLLMPHPQGIVVGGGAIVGAGCTIFHHVTLGEVTSRLRPGDHSYPILGAHVLVGTGAVVLGGVTVGDDAVIGANAVVVADVEPGDVVVGVPARSARSRGDRRRFVT
jgi:serine O-acetyltransferase